MQKTAWSELVLKPWTISCTPRSGRPRAGPEETIGLGHEPPNDRNRRPYRSTSTARTTWHCG